MTVSSDEELVAVVRTERGATNTQTFPQNELLVTLNEVKNQVGDEVAAAYDGGTPNIYDSSPEIEMSKALLSLRVEDLKRQRTPEAARTNQPIPTHIGKLRRTTFEDSELNYLVERVLTSFNKLTS